MEKYDRERGGIALRHPSYVVVTPARNESRSIEATIRSMLVQTVRPLKWVIVSDGSTDGTDDIVKKYSDSCTWIEFLRMPERKERNFVGKVYAFNAGAAVVNDLPYEVIANLDADITFDKDYFEYLLGKLEADPKLGLVGTPFREASREMYDYRFVNIEHVSGACQVFRRKCFEDFGGYVPNRGGAVDNIAVVTVRMKGWKTQTFIDKVCFHHREIGTAERSRLYAKYKHGIKDYSVGNHPVWELFRSVYQMTKKPVVLGGIALEAGYLWASMRHVERPVSHEFIQFYRQEQMGRLKTAFMRIVFSGRRLISPHY